MHIKHNGYTSLRLNFAPANDNPKNRFGLMLRTTIAWTEGQYIRHEPSTTAVTTRRIPAWRSATLKAVPATVRFV
jgi:hypothetical protein